MVCFFLFIAMCPVPAYGVSLVVYYRMGIILGRPRTLIGQGNVLAEWVFCAANATIYLVSVVGKNPSLICCMGRVNDRNGYCPTSYFLAGLFFYSFNVTISLAARIGE